MGFEGGSGRNVSVPKGTSVLFFRISRIDVKSRFPVPEREEIRSPLPVPSN